MTRSTVSQHNSIGEHDRITILGISYRKISISNGTYTFERVYEPGITENFRVEELRKLLASPDLRIDRGYFDVALREVGTKSAHANLEDYDRAIAADAHWAKACCDAFLVLYQQGAVLKTRRSIMESRLQLDDLAQKLGGASFSEAQATRPGQNVPRKKFPSADTLLVWLRKYERGCHSALALIKAYHRSGNHGSRLSSEELRFAYGVVEEYCTTQRPTQKKAIRRVQDRIRGENRRRAPLGLPSIRVVGTSTLRKILSQLSPYYAHAKRFGVEAANRKFVLFRTGIDDLEPLERVEMDEWKVDVKTLLGAPGILEHLEPARRRQLEQRRLWLYVATDCATGCILAMRLVETPSSIEAIKTLRDVLRDKSDLAEAAGCQSNWNQHGQPMMIVCDQGSAFMSEDFGLVIAALGGTRMHPVAGRPHLRSRIERLFGTFGQLLMPHLLGRTFFDPRERGDYPSEKLACLSDDDLITIFITFAVDIYHNIEHAGNGGETPANAWKRRVGTQHLSPVDSMRLRSVFGERYSRKIFGDGVHFANLSYSCPELDEAFKHSPKRDVEIRVDHSDLGWIAVRIGDGTYPARCNMPGFDGVAYPVWMEACRALRHRYKREAELTRHIVADAYDRVDETVRRAMIRMEQTPWHTRDIDVARNEEVLHIGISRSDSSETVDLSGNDILANAIEIAEPQGLPKPITESAPQRPEKPVQDIGTSSRPSSSAWEVDYD